MSKKFIKKARLVHGDRYDYSKVKYVGAHKKVIIICKEHGEFEQTPNGHLSKRGCITCGKTRTKLKLKTGTTEFIKKSKKIHGNRYDYSKVNYINSRTKVIIICKEHGDFEQTPYNHINNMGCSKCSKKYKPTTKEFIKKAQLKHGNRYDYSKVNYINSRTKVIIICKKHGDFEQTPKKHLNQYQGCPTCGKRKKLSTEEFISKANEVHGDKYDYSKVEYINWYTKVPIICKEHGKFWQRPNDHTNKPNNCPKCVKSNYSQKAINWLNQTAKQQNLYIQHAENEGEYLIPGTNYKADGFCKETNTIYEFYGDIWHGNLNLFEEDELCHPYKDECAGSLYMKTKQREQEIKGLGYNLVSIWENEYNNNTFMD